MTFAKAVLKRKPFECRIMGMPFSVGFNEDWCDLADAAGISRFSDGMIVLNPKQGDSQLLDTASHEIIEHANERMDWKMSETLIQQLGVLVGSMLECDC